MICRSYSATTSSAAAGQGIKGPGRAEGNATIARFMCKDDSCDDNNFTHNVILGIDRHSYPGPNYNLCPNDNRCDPDFSLVGFKDPAGGNFGLRDDSPFKSMATDGTDIGADIANTQIRNLTVVTSPRQAIFSTD